MPKPNFRWFLIERHFCLPPIYFPFLPERKLHECSLQLAKSDEKNDYWECNSELWLCLVFHIKGQKLIWSTFMEVAERHLESGSPPGGLEELHHGAELWAFNTDFSLEFPQPLMPYTVLVGGLLNQPAKPPEQVSSLDPHFRKHQWDIKDTSFCLLHIVFIHTAYSIDCSYPTFSDLSGSSAVVLQLWRGRFHCCDSGINGLFHLCWPSTKRTGCWLLRDTSGSALEVKGWHTGLQENCIFNIVRNQKSFIRIEIKGTGTICLFFFLGYPKIISTITIILAFGVVSVWCCEKLLFLWRFPCRYDPQRWPAHLDRPPNLRLMDWLPLNDLLGSDSLISYLFVTNGEALEYLNEDCSSILFFYPLNIDRNITP